MRAKTKEKEETQMLLAIEAALRRNAEAYDQMSADFAEYAERDDGNDRVVDERLSRTFSSKAAATREAIDIVRKARREQDGTAS